MGEEMKYIGRIDYVDPNRVFSKLGVLEGDNKEYINLERFMDGYPIFLIRNDENLRVVNNKLSHGDIICIEGDYQEDTGYIVGKNIEILSNNSVKNFDFIDHLKEIKTIVKEKSNFTKTIRDFFEKKGYLEFQET